jgi:steroid delta-isomerase-like uncharacterized protein
MAYEQERNKTLALKLYEEVWNKGNLDYIDVAVSPDFVDHPPERFSPRAARGRDSLVETASAFRQAFPDFHDEMVKIVAEGDRVAYFGRFTGTHQGPFFQYAPTGKKINVTGINFLRFEDAKIVERWSIFDVMALMQQLGTMPSGPGGH